MICCQLKYYEKLLFQELFVLFKNGGITYGS
nr:MAG TPA: hypothetical protein [Caudoviricetes sp.]